MFHEFFRWMQEDLGYSEELVASWSQQLLGSFNLWSLLEGTHVVTLMLFAGTIWIVDLRMLGVAFKNVPFSKINDKILPYTVIGFGMMVLTGMILFFAKPMDYYHNMWFRLKLIFLVLAAINIFWFHFRVQKNQDEWDSSPNPPLAVKASAVISMSAWILIIIFGRFIAYNWYECGKPQPAFVNWISECAATEGGVVNIGDMDEEVFEEEVTTGDGLASEEAVPTEEELAPDSAAPADAAPVEGE